MHPYRSHHCAELTLENLGEKIRLSGWVHRKRDHGGVVFVDLRDQYGLTQCVVDTTDVSFRVVEGLKNESVVTITGSVRARSDDTVNPSLPTGSIEVHIEALTLQSEADTLPLQVNSDEDSGEDVRLRYRYLDLRRQRPHDNIMLRARIIQSIRQRMIAQDFTEFQTPILTGSSPEGARDFLVPARLHPGKFYALPQAPQQFKQLIMVSGFDKYFQIAPCFRDEDSRADRSPGEFYQLDLEMSFVEQEDVFNIVEKLMVNTFKNFSDKKLMYNIFPKIPYSEAMLKYGSDKPDLRNPLIINDITEIFSREDVSFDIFKKLVRSGSKVRSITTKDTKDKPRSFFDNIDKWAKDQGASGLAYFTFEKDNKISAKGPVGKFFSEEALLELMKITKSEVGDSIFLACGKQNELEKITALARDKIAKDLDLIDDDTFAFCWIVDYPMFEKDESTNNIKFSHNPFSMPQGELKDKDFENPLDILAFQYDIVCNGIELSSGAIRNHKPNLMYKLFSIAGYSKEEVNEKFSGMINALSYGAPPHGGIAPGIDRIVMLLANEKNIREVTMFPMNQNAQDLMMNAPSEINQEQLKELNLSIKIKN